VRAANDGLPGSFAYALTHAGNNDVITFALARLSGRGAAARRPVPDTLIRNLTIKGPGANLLTISGDQNGDLTPDRQLFRIRSRVTFEGVTLAHGTAAFGGALQVESNGTLVLRRCAVVDSVAAQYGGAIDVDGGQLTLDGCFIARNRLSADTGLSGGGVSVYSDKELRIVNTTFADNQQPNPNGDGGGALVVQNRTPALPLDAYLTHCTFIQNDGCHGPRQRGAQRGLRHPHPPRPLDLPRLLGPQHRGRRHGRLAVRGRQHLRRQHPHPEPAAGPEQQRLPARPRHRPHRDRPAARAP
jgi:hypothetical protein